MAFIVDLSFIFDTNHVYGIKRTKRENGKTFFIHKFLVTMETTKSFIAGSLSDLRVGLKSDFKKRKYKMAALIK